MVPDSENSRAFFAEHSNCFAVTREDDCLGFGECPGRCQMDALSVNENEKKKRRSGSC
jgi:NAD-dependent dihydropyrimidine dehydrogenase PreA subunit